MKILFIGTGVIGTVYGWQLAEIGHSVTHFVRTGKAAQIEQEGILIRGADLRKRQNQPFDFTYQPVVTEEISAGYDLIVVPLQRTQLPEVLPLLAGRVGQADILFFQNIWSTQDIERYLQPGQYLYGFPRLVAGHKEGNRVECTIFSNPGQATMLGERDGQFTPRLESIKEMFQEADLRPQIAPHILGWLAAHYVEWIGPVGAILEAGSVQAFARNTTLIRKSILATREGLEVCRARGYAVQKAAPQNLRLLKSLPLFLTIWLARCSTACRKFKRCLRGI